MPHVAAMEKLLDLEPAVLSFFEAEGPKTLVFAYQPRGGARPALRELDDGNTNETTPMENENVLTLSTDPRTA